MKNGESSKLSTKTSKILTIKICNNVNEFNESLNFDISFEDSVLLYSDKLCEIQDRHIPIKARRMKNHQIKWFNSNIIDMTNKRVYYKTLSDKSTGNIKLKYFVEYKKARNRTVYLVRRSKKNYMNEALTEAENDVNKTFHIWKTLRAVIPTKKGLSQYSQHKCENSLDASAFNALFRNTREND
jgi:hypothetical protein